MKSVCIFKFIKAPAPPQSQGKVLGNEVVNMRKDVILNEFSSNTNPKWPVVVTFLNFAGI